jgi:hypothetical protein
MPAYKILQNQTRVLRSCILFKSTCKVNTNCKVNTKINIVFIMTKYYLCFFGEILFSYYQMAKFLDIIFREQLFPEKSR